MKKQKHTPGRWTIGGHSQGAGEDWREIVTDAEPFKGSLVANCLAKDAALIASAPDLLYALECALTQIDDLSEALQWALNQIEDSLDPDHEAALNAALFTLAKAKGEA